MIDVKRKKIEETKESFEKLKKKGSQKDQKLE